jgi:hypothetical protein
MFLGLRKNMLEYRQNADRIWYEATAIMLILFLVGFGIILSKVL